MIYHIIPSDFKPKFKVASCYLESQGKILLLLRNGYKDEGNKWGVPAGKIQTNEKPRQAIIREVQEETGFVVSSKELRYLSKVYVRYPNYDFVYYMFLYRVPEKPSIQINPLEHDHFSWATPQKALNMKLVSDLDLCIKMQYFF